MGIGISPNCDTKLPVYEYNLFDSLLCASDLFSNEASIDDNPVQENDTDCFDIIIVDKVETIEKLISKKSNPKKRSSSLQGSTNADPTKAQGRRSLRSIEDQKSTHTGRMK